MLLIFASVADTVSAEDAGRIASPRIRAVSEAVQAGDRSALADFWRWIESHPTPLVEPVAGEPDEVWLTVVWRGDDQTRNVLLIGELAPGHPLDRTMTRLLDTDLWYWTCRTRNDLRATYRFSPNDPLELVPMDDEEAQREQRKNYRNDPYNPRAYGGSLVELSNAPPQPWIEDNRNAPRGELRTERAFKSHVLGNERQIGVYLPAGYDDAGEPYPLVLLFDRESYTSLVPTPRILDRLIHARKIPPVVAIIVGNVPGRRNEELPCHEPFADFVATELMPWARAKYNVTIDPAESVIGGSSFGGLAASFIAFRHPELFGNVISQSGSYWWSPDTNTDYLPEGVEGEWLTRQYAESDVRSIRFFIEAGLNEGGAPSMVEVNRRFRDVLNAKGYEVVVYNEYNGGHDYLNWRGSLAEALIALIGE